MGNVSKVLFPLLLLLLAEHLLGDHGEAICPSAHRTTLRTVDFRAVLDAVAHAWNTGQADLAVACFTDDAVYMEPPDRQYYKGTGALREFFRASVQPVRSDRMRWHFVAFDEVGQTGFGEYTYRGRQFYHGIAVIRLQDGRIRNWREYQYTSRVHWEDFVGPNR